MRRFSPPLALLCFATLLAGCAGTPPAPTSRGEQIADRALAQLGKPYRYGGNGPDAFDCSGLVRYAHLALGIAAPRTAAAQFDAAHKIPREALTPGDLLFFRIGGTVSHVGIYAGDGRFVHAPQTGRPVETRPIDDSYYRTRLVGVGRLY
jgi:cell wall-associated NlpC family hydrolase